MCYNVFINGIIQCHLFLGIHRYDTPNTSVDKTKLRLSDFFGTGQGLFTKFLQIFSAVYRSLSKEITPLRAYLCNGDTVP